MLSVSILIAIASLFITPPNVELFTKIDWRTLATLFMLLTVLEGFKKENIFAPLLRLTSKLSSLTLLTCFFVYSVFVLSMFVTNDVSLIIIVPLTIAVFRTGNKEKFLIPVLVLENIAAIRGSLLTPFGSPQNLFVFSQSKMDAVDFVKMMLPLSVGSAVLLFLFILVLYKKNLGEKIAISAEDFSSTQETGFNTKKIIYLSLFALITYSIISRTSYWPFIAIIVSLVLLIFDWKIFLKTDYALIFTFLCFFVFSSSIGKNPTISLFLQKNVAGNEYLWAILLSQLISNVPAAVVLWPFSTSTRALLYGLDSAGLCSIIGSLASVINLRIYTKEYPKNAGKFIKTFTLISLAFFAIVVLPQFFIISALSK